MYISAHISYNGNSADIDFPVSDEMLNVILENSEMPTDTTLPFLVEDIHYPIELSALNARNVNLDELNFLARRLDSFTEEEIEQFFAATEHENAQSLKNMINLTYNLDKFTLIKNVGDMTKVGRDYTLNTEGCVPADSRYDAKYAEIGRKLLASGRGVFTERGLLFVEDKPIEEVYDGKTFPGFAYQSFIVNVDVEYKGRYESLFLPESQLAIDKAVRRLGAESIDDCDLSSEYGNPNFSRFSVRFEEILDNEGIDALNELAYELNTYDIDTEKLDAAMEMTDVKSSKNIITLINHLDEFEWLNDISYGDYEGIGRYFVDNDYYDEYEISDELCDYFDFAEFGAHMADEKSGQFVNGGFIFCDGEDGFDSFMDKFEDESSSMTMGGM
ncbi:hypothetical protein [Ruminococcus sp. JE7B6]|uniref:hypothetical protein n=1 Tax=Ruminococcus sp. JE7B6 TaxID=3233380 RepID=UPI003899ED37